MRKTLVCFLTILVAGGSIIAGVPENPAEQILEQYFLIHKSLAADSAEGVSAAAARIASISRQTAGTEMKIKTQLIDLSEAAARLQTDDLKTASNEFGELSKSLIAYLQAAGAKRNPPYQFFCPLVKKNWLQPDKDVRNPYFGKSMLDCGDLVLK